MARSGAAARIQSEIDRAEEALRGLVGQTVPALTLNSLDADDAPFLALINSKLSPIIGNLLERQITDLLTDEDGAGMEWVRQDPGFPDALLLDADGNSTDAGYEVKAWYTLSTELTGRFRESVRLLQCRQIRIVVIAWHLSHIVYGTPQVVGVLTVDALGVAKKRDQHYHRPPDYVCVEPQDTTARTRNLQQTNVAGYKWQGAAQARANKLVRSHRGRNKPPSTTQGEELANQLVSQFPYRLDTNFAKIDRIDHEEIERFKSAMLATEVRGRSLSDWRSLLRDLRDPQGSEYQDAADEIQRIYDDL